MDLVERALEATGEVPREILRSIINIQWQDLVTNLEALHRPEMTSVETPFGWSRDPDDHSPSRSCMANFYSGNRVRGRPRKRLKSNITHSGFRFKELELCTIGKPGYRGLTIQTRDKLEEKRQADVA